MPPDAGMHCHAGYVSSLASQEPSAAMSNEAATTPVPSAKASDTKSALSSTMEPMRSATHAFISPSSLETVVSLVMTREGISSATMRAGLSDRRRQTSTPPGAS